jgi:hypothetical protein
MKTSNILLVKLHLMKLFSILELIQNYFESIGNRVLSIDDVSGSSSNSDSKSRIHLAPIDEFPLSYREFRKVYHLC